MNHFENHINEILKYQCPARDEYGEARNGLSMMEIHASLEKRLKMRVSMDSLDAVLKSMVRDRDIYFAEHLFRARKVM